MIKAGRKPDRRCGGINNNNTKKSRRNQKGCHASAIKPRLQMENKSWGKRRAGLILGLIQAANAAPFTFMDR